VNDSVFYDDHMFDKLKTIAKVPKIALAGSVLPAKLTVGLTYRCQSRCNHCDIWKLYQNNPENCRDEAQSSVYLQMFDYLRDSILWLEFTGGEPFLRKEIVEIVSFAMNNTGIVAAAITSNGLDEGSVVKKVTEILERSKKKQLVIGVSIDGDPCTYERVRGLNGFKHAMRTMLELRQISSSYKNLRPHIAYTINHLNAGSFSDFYRFVSEEYGIGIFEISFTVEHPFGFYFQNCSATSRKSAVIFKKQALKDIQFIRDLRNDTKLSCPNPLHLFYDYYLKNVSTYFMNPMQQVIPCKACSLSAFIDPYGNVHPCTMWNNILGNLKEKSFRSIWDSQQRKLAMQTVRASRCPNCWTPCEAQPSWLLNLGFVKGWW
jgi:MoaA/NifB/PqqE/SkfB family radical SAM enzyme